MDSVNGNPGDTISRRITDLWSMTETEVFALGAGRKERLSGLGLARRLGSGGWTLLLVVLAVVAVTQTGLGPMLDAALTRLTGA